MVRYNPPWYLRNNIAMWAWANFVRLPRKPKYEKPYQKVSNPSGNDGSFFELAWLRSPDNERVALFAPGLGGGDGSRPTRGMVRALHKAEWDVAVWVFRDTGRTPTSVGRTYSGNDIDDLELAVGELDGYEDIALVGTSLGGAMVLQYATRIKNPNVKKVVAISPPIDFGACVEAWSTGFMGKFVISPLSKARMRRKAIAKASQPSAPIDEDDAKAYGSVRTLTEVDQYINTRFNEERYRSASHYWYKATTARDLWVCEFTVPTLIITARDDFLLDARSYPHPEHLPDNVTLEITRFGSHVGFVQRGGCYWSEQRTVEHLG